MKSFKRTYITQPITSSGDTFEEKKRLDTYENPKLVNRFSSPLYNYNNCNI